MAASLTQNLSFLYISSVFVHVVALFLEQISPGLPTAVHTFPLTSAFRKDTDLAPIGFGPPSPEEDECQFINCS